MARLTAVSWRLIRRPARRPRPTQLTDLKKCYGCLFSSTPVLAGDVLVGGTTGGDQPIAGQIFGVDALTGKLLWTLKTTKDDPKSWPGDTGAVGGSTAWNVGTYDPTSDTVFIGVGNAAPDFYWNDRHGDNLYAATMLALDPKTGNIKWHRQEVPGDHYDYDAVYEALVVDEENASSSCISARAGSFSSWTKRTASSPMSGRLRKTIIG